MKPAYSSESQERSDFAFELGDLVQERAGAFPSRAGRTGGRVVSRKNSIGRYYIIDWEKWGTGSVWMHESVLEKMPILDALAKAVDDNGL